MKRTLVNPDLNEIPVIFHPYLTQGPVFNSSSSPAAQVLYIPGGEGFFLKSGPKGSLDSEAVMGRYLAEKGLSAQVIAYESLERDWLLTKALPGEDCLWEEYIQSPQRLCDATAELLRMLHDTPCQDCPIPDRTALSIATAIQNCEAGHYEAGQSPDNWCYASAREALQIILRDGGSLKSDTLPHGDYCLPNIILKGWHLSGFIDVGAGGVGDRHKDLFWGIWSLAFNLKTDRYRDRFLDAYGRDRVNEDVFPVIAALEVFL